MTQDDLLLPVWSMVFAMAQELGNVRAVCRAMGIHLSTYYRWKHQLDHHGPEILRPPERRLPRLANPTRNGTLCRLCRCRDSRRRQTWICRLRRSRGALRWMKRSYES